MDDGVFVKWLAGIRLLNPIQRGRTEHPQVGQCHLKGDILTWANQGTF